MPLDPSTEPAGAPIFEDRPPAKVNLTLEVIGRRADGFHDLRSIILRIGLTDRLRISPGGAEGSDRLTVTGLPGAPTRDNLVRLALDAMRRQVGVALPNVDVWLDKSIPAAAGLGGGSSDCASAIKLAQAYWAVRLSEAEEMSLAADLGSDVPFFVSDAAVALVEGRGERATPLAPVASAGVLLVTPPVSLATADVFARHDEVPANEVVRVSDDLATALSLILDGEGLSGWVGRLRDANDLWPAAASLAPSLPELRVALEEWTDRPWLMSGSGPTLFAIYPSVESAVEDGKALVTDRPEALDGSLIHAVDPVGPDPAWRCP